MNITIYKPCTNVFLFGNTRCLWISAENCWISGKVLENLLTGYRETQLTIIFGIGAQVTETKAYVFHPYTPSHIQKRKVLVT